MDQGSDTLKYGEPNGARQVKVKDSSSQPQVKTPPTPETTNSVFKSNRQLVTLISTQGKTDQQIFDEAQKGLLDFQQKHPETAQSHLQVEPRTQPQPISLPDVKVAEDGTKRLILANLYISGLMLVLSFVTLRILLAGSAWIFLADSKNGLPGWVNLLFGLPLFSLLWIPTVKLVLGKMNYDPKKPGEVCYINVLISIIIFFGLTNS